MSGRKTDKPKAICLIIFLKSRALKYMILARLAKHLLSKSGFVSSNLGGTIPKV